MAPTPCHITSSELDGFIFSALNSCGSTRINENFIKLVGESLGLSEISEDVIRYISKVVTFKIISLLNDCRKFCLKSNRNRVFPVDIDNALLKQGFSSLSLNDSVYDMSFLQKIMLGSKLGEVVYFNDSEIEIDDFLKENKPKLGSFRTDVSIKAHWLAISGVQPCIPENPSSSSISQKSNTLASNELSTPTSLYLQLFYKELTEASIGTHEDKRKDAMSSLLRDPSVKYLIVPLCSFIFQGVRINVAARNLAILIYIMRMVCSLIHNGSIPPDLLEHHLHLLLPAIFTCILCPILCTKQYEENHWALRIYAGKLIWNLCCIFELSIPHLRFNIIEVLKSALLMTLDSVVVEPTTKEIKSNGKPYNLEDFPYGTFFGAFFVFSLMPFETSQTHLLPLVPRLGTLFEALNTKLPEYGNDFLKRDISKSELQLLQLLIPLYKKESLKSNFQIDKTMGKYFSAIITQQQSLNDSNTPKS